jgi:SAM-dependent methyltransferase/uncharacterized protein YbaR (Trm112 family)
MSASAINERLPLSPLVGLLTCLRCGSPLESAELAPAPGYPELGPDGWLRCASCGEEYPIIGGTPRMLDDDGCARLASQYPKARIELTLGRAATPGPDTAVSRRTADGFAYEWRHFGQLRPEWRKNFVDYLRPHRPEWLNGRLVLDVGAGSGRHSAQAAALGAGVIAVDLGQSIDVARRNLPPDVLTVQADARHLPFPDGTFDLVMSIGVLHHLPDTQTAISDLVPLVCPGGFLHIYLYWVPPITWHRALLRLVDVARLATVRLPYRLLHLCCYPLALVLWAVFVLPYRYLRRRSRGGRFARLLPLKTYADYPFGVLVNDQFDRFSAPIEHRFTRTEVQVMLTRAGLQNVVVLDNHGWLGDGRRPEAPPSSA